MTEFALREAELTMSTWDYVLNMISHDEDRVNAELYSQYSLLMHHSVMEEFGEIPFRVIS